MLVWVLWEHVGDKSISFDRCNAEWVDLRYKDAFVLRSSISWTNVSRGKNPPQTPPVHDDYEDDEGMKSPVEETPSLRPDFSDDAPLEKKRKGATDAGMAKTMPPEPFSPGSVQGTPMPDAGANKDAKKYEEYNPEKKDWARGISLSTINQRLVISEVSDGNVMEITGWCKVNGRIKVIVRTGPEGGEARNRPSWDCRVVKSGLKLQKCCPRL